MDTTVDHFTPLALRVRGNKKTILINGFSVLRPVRRILKRGVQGTAWSLGHDEGESAGGGCVPSHAKRKAFTLWMI